MTTFHIVNTWSLDHLFYKVISYVQWNRINVSKNFLFTYLLVKSEVNEDACCRAHHVVTWVVLNVGPSEPGVAFCMFHLYNALFGLQKRRTSPRLGPFLETDIE